MTSRWYALAAEEADCPSNCQDGLGGDAQQAWDIPGVSRQPCPTCGGTGKVPVLPAELMRVPCADYKGTYLDSPCSHSRAGELCPGWQPAARSRDTLEAALVREGFRVTTDSAPGNGSRVHTHAIAYNDARRGDSDWHKEPMDALEEAACAALGIAVKA